MIEKFCGICSENMSTLLEVYQMKDWGMTWAEFLDEFIKETLETVDEWKKENI
jgi:hypothetical protein